MSATCATCSAPLAARRSTRRFCSNKCRQRGYRNRGAETAAVTVEASPVEPPPVEIAPSPWAAWADEWDDGDDQW